MRPTLRLSINALAGRRSRTLLLVGAVAMSATLVAAVACALASLNAGMLWNVERQLGKADLRVQHVGEQRFDADVLDAVRADPDVALAAARLRGPVPVTLPSGEQTTLVGLGVDVEPESALFTRDVDTGRTIASGDAGAWEVTLDQDFATERGIELGDTLDVLWFGPQRTLTVVGLTQRKITEFVDRPDAVLSLSAAREVTGYENAATAVYALLREGADPYAVADRLAALLPDELAAEPTERITSGIASNIRANNFFFVLSSMLAYISAAFIVLTGMTTNMLERQRELAIMRCIGATRRQLAGAQLGVGAFVGAAGAAAGIPLGVGLAWTLAALFPERLPAGLAVTELGLFVAAGGAVLAGVLGASVPAWRAGSSRPLAAVRSQARPAGRGAVVACSAAGLAMVLLQAVLISVSNDGNFLFWSYATVGLPVMFIGYFLLGVPIVLIVSRLAAEPISRVLRLPRSVVGNTVRATPLRHGFTAGALMVGLGMMVSIWTNGSALLNDYLRAIEFPEAFVRGWLGLTEDDRDKLAQLDIVTNTCAITEQKIQTDAFGVTGFREPKTSFIAFEPEPFFDMVNLEFVAGEPAYARQRLIEGGAVIVAKEFLVFRPEFALGEMFPVEHEGETHEFEIVGAVTAPGLDLVSKYFNVGKEQADVSIHSVFGSRADLVRVFNNDSIDFIQLKLAEGVTDEQAEQTIRDTLDTTALVVGSGRAIKEEIFEIARNSMKIASAVAISAMLIGVLGVGNIVIAGIDARRFEFGVLRASGAHGSLLARLILAEVAVVALAACVVGTLIGLQGSWAGLRMYETLVGVIVGFRPPPLPIAAGWAALILLTLAMATPIALRLAARRPRELLAATRG